MTWTPGTPQAGLHRGQPNFDALEKRLAALEKVVNVSANGAVEIKSTTTITIKAGSTLKIEGAGSVEINGSGTVEIKGNAAVGIKGAVVKLNDGRQPVARVGDNVAGPVITIGNPTVLA